MILFVNLLFLFLSCDLFLSRLRTQCSLRPIRFMRFAEQTAGASIFRSAAFVVHVGYAVPCISLGSICMMCNSETVTSRS